MDIDCSNAGQMWECFVYWSVPSAWQFVLQWEGKHFAGEPSLNSVLQGVLVQEAKELLGVGWRGVWHKEKLLVLLSFSK